MTHELYLQYTPEVDQYIKGKRWRIYKALRWMAVNGSYTAHLGGCPLGICKSLQELVDNDGSGKLLEVYHLVAVMFHQLYVNWRSSTAYPIKGYDTVDGWEYRKEWCALFAKIIRYPNKVYRIPDALVASLNTEEE